MRRARIRLLGVGRLQCGSNLRNMQRLPGLPSSCHGANAISGDLDRLHLDRVSPNIRWQRQC
jgi:hypothetical protein